MNFKTTRRRLLHMAVGILIAQLSTGQTKNQSVTDNDKKFVYSDTAGLTASYLAYFGDAFNVPDLVTVDGRSMNQSELKGKIIVYNFWFVSCRPCVAEIPDLNRIAVKFRSDKIVFVGLTFDKADRIKAFLLNHDFQFQIASIPQAVLDSIKKISLYPFTAIVNKDGKLAFVLFGRPMGKRSTDRFFELLCGQIEKLLRQ